MVEGSTKQANSKVRSILRARAPRAMTVLREVSKTTGADGSDEAVLEFLRKRGNDGKGFWEGTNDWSQADLAGWLLDEALATATDLQECIFSGHGLEAMLKMAVPEFLRQMREGLGANEVAERHFQRAVDAALAEDGGETLRHVRAAVKAWGPKPGYTARNTDPAD